MSMRCALWSSWVPVRPGVAPLRLLAAQQGGAATRTRAEPRHYQVKNL